MENIFKKQVDVLEEAGARNSEICTVLGITEQELSTYQVDRDLELSRLEREREASGLSEVQDGIKEWLEEPEMKEARKQYLLEASRRAARDPENPIYQSLKYRIRESFGEAITPEQIEKARTYPITELIKVRNNVALCPFHNDKNPSMSVSNNKWYCHACGEGGDVISFLMKKEGITFKEAITRLYN